jgi:hypothetical protein
VDYPQQRSASVHDATLLGKERQFSLYASAVWPTRTAKGMSIRVDADGHFVDVDVGACRSGRIQIN